MFDIGYNQALFDRTSQFCKVVELDGFSAVARATGHKSNHVYKEIQRLEARPGIRLLNRATHKISLTESGQVYCENARRLVYDARAVEERLHMIGVRPFGVVRMSAPVVVAQARLNSWLPALLARHHEVSLQIDFAERRADMVAEGIQLLMRVDHLRSSDIIARELFRTAGVAVPSSENLDRKGLPNHPSDLVTHELIDLSFHGVTQAWSFQDPDGQTISVPVTPRVRCKDAETEKALASAAPGITRMPEIAYQREPRPRALVRILQSFEHPPTEERAIYASREHLPPKT